MTRARDDFARLLDGDPTGSGPEGAPRALEALGLARRELDTAVVVRPEFREALRTRLLAVAAVRAEAPAPTRPAPVGLLTSLRARRRAAALSGALAGVVALTGMGVAASRSVPGDVFYGAKLAAEDVRLGLADGEAGEQGLRRLQLATARLSELEALSASGRTLGLAAAPSAAGRPLAAGVSRRDVLGVLDEMDDDVRDGFALMLDAYRQDGDRASLEVVRGWSVEQAARLRALLPRLGPALQLRGEGSLAVVRGVETEVVRLLALPAPGASTEGSPPASPDLPEGPSASAGPPSSGGVADVGEPRPTSPVDADGGALSEPVAGEDAPPRPAPPAPPAAPRRAPAPDPVPTVVVPSVVVPSAVLPSAVLPSAGLPTVDLPVPALPSLPDGPVDGLPGAG